MASATGFISPSYYYWDPEPPGAVATTQDHHGPSYLYVAALEAGYASWRSATFNDQSMTLVQSMPQHGPYPYIIGYVQIYVYYGNRSSGTFQYHATSMVAPVRILSTSLYVRRRPARVESRRASD